jgi:hypothetical protein
MVAVLGNSGKVEVELETSGGRRRRWRTGERVLPWPEGWSPLGVGERGRVRVWSCGQRGEAWFVRAKPLAPTLFLREPAVGVPILLRVGLPMEAFRLGAKGGFGRETDRTQAMLRAEVPPFGQWRLP